MPETLDRPLLPTLHPAPAAQGGLRVGVDTIEIADVAASLRHFGRRYTERLFTAAELDYALAVPALAPQRLAARFAAKEAAIKLLNLCELGLNWRDIEVRREPDGACNLVWHGQAAAQLAALPPCDTALSLSHDAAHAVAVVVMLPRVAPAETLEATGPALPTARQPAASPFPH